MKVVLAGLCIFISLAALTGVGVMDRGDWGLRIAWGVIFALLALVVLAQPKPRR